MKKIQGAWFKLRSGFVVAIAPIVMAACGGSDDPANDIAAVDPAAFVRAAGQDFTVASAATVPLVCQGPKGTAYTWSIESNGGLPIDLSSYSAQRTSFTAPAVLQPTRVTLLCKMTNGPAPLIESRVTVTIQPTDLPPAFNPADYVAAAGQDFTVTGGSTAPFFCAGPTGSSYQWVVQGNGGLAIDLASYNTQRTSFTAPIVSKSTTVVLACRMTVGASTVLTSTVNATVLPTSALTLLTSVTGNKTAVPGERVALSASAVWYDEKAAIAPGPVPTYLWSLGAGAPAGTLITPSTSSKDVEILMPATVTSAVFFPVTVKATAGDKTSSATITMLIDPNAGLTLSITPPAQAVAPGAVVTVSTSASSKLFYQWTIVSGASVTLGGATTSSVGFVAPSTLGDIRLRVAIGYAPITSTNPGVYFLESVVSVR